MIVPSDRPVVSPLLRLGLGLAASALASACASAATRANDPAPALATDANAVVSQQLDGCAAHADAGRWTDAQRCFGSLLRSDLRNPKLQFLNGLAYERMARTGDRDLLDLAQVGFETAGRMAPSDYWSHVYTGYLQLERGEPGEAQQSFARAVRADPGRWQGLYGLGVASYYAGDAIVARLAADKARQLAPKEPEVLRLAAFAAAADGDPVAESLARDYEALARGGADVRRRVGEVLRDARLMQVQATTVEAPPAAPAASAPTDPRQVMVDVTIVLSSLLKVENRGVNLFDGLSVQFGYNNSLQTSRTTGSPSTATRTITQAIGVPQLTYNLNLFNDSGQFYQVIARPTLTAYLGRESDFFAGRVVNVKVSGVNLGTLQPIDVGVGLKVTPEAIDGNRVTFRVAAQRSFLSREEVGTFEESLTVFRQLVNATAEVEFGQTLLLSALSENVQDSNFSKTPLLGEIPIVKSFTSRSSTANRKESLLILLTPMAATTVATGDGRLPSSAVREVLELWRTIVDPASSVEAVSRRLRGSKFFQRAASGDLRWGSVMTTKMAQEAVRENVALAAR